MEENTDKHDFKLTEEQLQILIREREEHLTGETKSYTREEAFQIIRRQRDL